MILWLLACATAQRPLAPGEAPDLVLVPLAGPPPAPAEGEARVAPVWAAQGDPAKSRGALLTSQWSPRPGANTLAGVLQLYGYHTATLAGADDAKAWGFGEAAGPDWAETVPEPFLVVADGTRAAVEEWRARLAERGLRDRTAFVLVWADGTDAPGAIGWLGPGAPPPLAAGQLASTLDVLPTLIAAAHGTVPTDAAGTSLADPKPPRRAVFQETADGGLVVRSSRHVLRARAVEPLPEACPDDAVLTTADGAPADDAEARRVLWDALRGWRARLAATTAREKLGADDFVRLNAQQGYWQ